MGNIEHVGADDVRYLGQNGGQTLGVVRLVNVGQVFPLCLFAGGITDIIDIETECFGQIVEAFQLQLFLSHETDPMLYPRQT